MAAPLRFFSRSSQLFLEVLAALEKELPIPVTEFCNFL
jgi:hypothetical protein